MITRLITEDDVLAGRVRSPLVLDASTLLTPAARDRAVQKGLVVVERDGASTGTRGAETRCPSCGAGAAGGRCAACGAGAARGAGAAGGAGAACGAGVAGWAGAGAAGQAAGGAGAPRLDELGDGLYLLRIAGGRAVSILPAAGAGLLAASEAARARRGAGAVGAVGGPRTIGGANGGR